MPLIKLVGIAIKSLSKPISTYVKAHLIDTPAFAKSMVFIGRRYQRLTNFITGTSNLQELEHDAAITIGSETTVEFLFFALAGGIILYDNGVSKKKSAMLNDKINVLTDRVNKLEVDYKKIEITN